MTFKDYQNIHELVKETVDHNENRIAYKWFTETGQTEFVTWQDLYHQAQQVAKSLMALNVQKNDKVNIISNTNYKWVLSDCGINFASAVTVGIYQSNLAKDCAYIINHSDAVIVFAEDQTQLDKLLEIRSEIPNVRHVVLYKGDSFGDDWVMSFETFLSKGHTISDDDYQKRVDSTTPQDTASIVYTSGTTGVPKGAVLTHDNITFTAQSVNMSLSIQKFDDTFVFLPLAHVFARTCVYTAIIMANTTTFATSIDTLVDDIKAAKPHWFASVPRIYEKIYAKVISGAEAKGGAALAIFNWALDVGYQVSDLKLNKTPIPFLLGLKYQLATKLVFSKIQAALGGRVRWCISGAAPLNETIAKFFHAASVLIVEGIGMTENTSFTNVNRTDNYKFGWVGQPGPGIEQKLGEDGEVLFRGRNVMKEYYKMPEETAKDISPDGWLRTGDIGEIDGNGFLRITGRKKELIITAGGKNVAPSAIEGMIATSKYINQVFVIGDRRKYLSALITVDSENIMAFADENGIPYHDITDLIENERIIALVENEVTKKNKGLASFETIKQITLVPEFTVDNGILTPTMKIKKNVAAERYKEKIDAMYHGD